MVMAHAVELSVLYKSTRGAVTFLPLVAEVHVYHQESARVSKAEAHRPSGKAFPAFTKLSTAETTET